MKAVTGKIGRQESVAMLCIALWNIGLFFTGNNLLFDQGNSSFVSVPLAVIVASIPFFTAVRALKELGEGDLYDLLRLALGKVGAVFYSCLMALFLLVAAAVPLAAGAKEVLLQAQGNGMVLVLLCGAAVLFIAYKGLECLSRTSLFFGWLLFAGVVVLVLMRLGDLRALRLLPFVPFDNLRSFREAFDLSGVLGAVLLMGLTFTSGMHGVKNATRSGKRSVFLSAILLLLLFGILGMLYPSKVLLTKEEPAFLLAGSIGVFKMKISFEGAFACFLLSAFSIGLSYAITAGANLYSKAFFMHDVRPCTFAFCAISFSFVYALVKDEELLYSTRELFFTYGSLIITVPSFIISLIALGRARRGRKKQ